MDLTLGVCSTTVPSVKGVSKYDSSVGKRESTKEHKKAIFLNETFLSVAFNLTL